MAEGSSRARFAVDGHRLRLGPLLVSFQRTAQVAGAATPPSSHGAAPIAESPTPGAAADLVVPVADDEAIWLGFEPEAGSEVAVRVEVVAPVAVDAATGRPPAAGLLADPQNYLVCPLQRSLDGVADGAHPGRARQLVRRPDPDLDPTGRIEVALLRITAVPRPGAAARLPAEPGPRPLHAAGEHAGAGRPDAAGVPQVILPDPRRLAGWDTAAAVSATVQLLAPDTFEAVTGRPAPPAARPEDRYRGWRLP